MEFLRLYLIGERWRLPASEASDLSTSSSATDDVIDLIPPADGVDGVDTAIQEYGRPEVDTQMNVSVDTQELSSESTEARMRSWCANASRGPFAYRRRDFRSSTAASPADKSTDVSRHLGVILRPFAPHLRGEFRVAGE